MKKYHITFLFFFIILTFLPLPVFSVFREQIGYKNTENKAETSFPVPTAANYTSWPRHFEEWLSDNLPFKTQFIEFYRLFQFRNDLDYTQSDVIRGKEDRLFYRKTVENYKGLTRFTEDELQLILENLTSFFTQMEAGGTKCLFYIAPDKEQVYSDSMPESIRRVSEESRGDQLAAFLKEHASFPVLYPKAQLKEAARAYPVYYNTDTHWNNLGGWFAAGQIRSAFTGSTENDKEPRYHHYESEGKDLAGMLGLSEWMPEKNAVEMEFDDGLNIFKTQTINHGNIQRFTSDDPHSELHKRLMVIGDSFAEYYIRSAIHDIKDILFVTYGDLYMIDLAEEAPHYLVVMLVERNLPFLLEGFH